jgi:hypothetical protein
LQPVDNVTSTASLVFGSDSCVRIDDRECRVASDRDIEGWLRT